MKLLQSFVIASALYSKIPMPQVEWNRDNMRYVMCFFPAIGAVTGLCVWLAGQYLLKSHCGTMFSSVLLTLIPVVINGGIHLDGFMDTMDALSSYGDREKKLAILKDSHAGAFAILGLCCYMLLMAALWSEVTIGMLPLISLGYVLSRALSGFSIVMFPAARDSGLARTFQDGANRRRTGVVMTGWAVLAVGAMMVISPVMAAAAVSCAGLVFIYYRNVSMKQFGGITGDLAGYFLQLCELGMLIGIVLTGGIGWS